MIHIISDSSTLYSIESAKKKGLSIVPLNISVDSQTYRDFEDITSTQLLTMIEEHKIPKTSQPSLGEKIDLYNKLSKDGDEVIDIAMASGLSGTYQTAMMAKDSCDNRLSTCRRFADVVWATSFDGGYGFRDGK